jgi:hypothetical protein
MRIAMQAAVGFEFLPRRRCRRLLLAIVAQTTTRFPRLERYTSRLPNGIDSYAEHRCKAAVYRVFTDSVDLTSFPFDEAPPAVRTLLKNAFLHDTWLPEAHVMGTIHAVSDFLGYDDEATLRWMDECNGRLLSGRMYRALMSLASPSILITVASRQWSLLHRGVKFSVERGNPGRIHLAYPDELYDELVARGIGTAVRHALALSRAKNPRVQVEKYSPSRVTYHVEWS